jgi:hypothetical protein
MGILAALEAAGALDDEMDRLVVVVVVVVRASTC